MKRKSVYSSLLAGILLSLLTLTSCLGDNVTEDSNSKIQNAISTMKGPYSGTVLLGTLGNDGFEADTLRIVAEGGWTATDSLVIKNFPVASLAKGVSDNDDVKVALEAFDTPTKVTLYYSYNFAFGDNAYSFTCLSPGVRFKLTYGGTTHDVFAELTSYISGWENGRMNLSFVISQLYIDKVKMSPGNFKAIGYVYNGKKSSV